MRRLVVAAVRALALLAWTGILLVPCLAGRAVAGRAPPVLVRAWHRGCCRITGLHLRVSGVPAAAGSTLFVANHVSYLDIVVLGSLVDAGFVAKAEVAKWPLIGQIARIGRTVFVERRSGRSVGQREEIAARLAAGDSLILFAEGTSSDGGRVLPFKSALFAAAEAQPGAAIKVQPVTIAYARLRCGLPIDYALRPLYAWYGDMALAPHLWAVLGLPGAVIEVRFHPPVVAADFGSRKALARHAEREVANGLAAARLAA
ncbi:MAG TPA: lysophospholipid acyltransferase family protein [Geminicoccaceae bacterium]|nr:lysophospholipid acyltransferase family protein [Geminicoccaceae bacterium]